MIEWWKNFRETKVFKATANVLVGQVVGDIVAATFVVFQDKVPWIINGTEKLLRKTIIDPNLKWFEDLSDKYGYTTAEEREKRKTQTKDERAHKIAEPLAELAATGIVGTGAAFFAQKLVEQKAHAGFKNIFFSRAADTVVHVGALILLNTTFNKQTTHASHAASKILQNVGLKKDTADRTADYFVRRKPADLIGFSTGLAILATGVSPLNYIRR